MPISGTCTDGRGAVTLWPLTSQVHTLRRLIAYTPVRTSACRARDAHHGGMYGDATGSRKSRTTTVHPASAGFELGPPEAWAHAAQAGGHVRHLYAGAGRRAARGAGGGQRVGAVDGGARQRGL